MALKYGVAERFRQDARHEGPASASLLRRFADASDALADLCWVPVPRPALTADDIKSPIGMYSAAEKLRLLANALETDKAEEIDRLAKAGEAAAEWQRQYETARVDLETARAQCATNEQLLTETEEQNDELRNAAGFLIDRLAEEREHYKTLQRVNGYLIKELEEHELVESITGEPEEIEIILEFGDGPGLTPAEAVALMLETVNALGGVEI